MSCTHGHNGNCSRRIIPHQWLANLDNIPVITHLICTVIRLSISFYSILQCELIEVGCNGMESLRQRSFMIKMSKLVCYPENKMSLGQEYYHGEFKNTQELDKSAGFPISKKTDKDFVLICMLDSILDGLI